MGRTIKENGDNRGKLSKNTNKQNVNGEIGENKENLSKKNENFDLINYLTNRKKQTANVFSFSKNNQCSAKQSSVDRRELLKSTSDSENTKNNQNSNKIVENKEYLSKKNENFDLIRYLTNTNNQPVDPVSSNKRNKGLAQQSSFDRRELLKNTIDSANTNNNQNFNKIVENKQNLSKKNQDFDLINYLTTRKNRTANSLLFSKRNSSPKQSSFDQLSEKSSNHYFEWLSTPEKSINFERTDENQNDKLSDTNSMNISIDSFMESLMNPVIQSQYNISPNNFDNVMNSFLSSRRSSRDKDEAIFEKPELPRLLSKTTTRKSNSSNISKLSKNSVRDSQIRQNSTIPQVIDSNSSSENCNFSQKSSQKSISQVSNSNSSLANCNFSQKSLRSSRCLNNSLVGNSQNSNRKSSIGQITKRKTVGKSENSPKRRRTIKIIYPEISIKNILIPNFETNIVTKFNNSWISHIGSIKWLESRVKENVINEMKLVKVNIFIGNFDKQLYEKPIKIRYSNKNKLKIYKLQCLLSKNRSNQNLDGDAVLQLLSQNENVKIQSDTVHDFSFNLNDSQISEASLDSTVSMSQQTLRNGLNQICQNQSVGSSRQCKDLSSIGKLLVLSRIQEIFVRAFQAFQDSQIPCLNVRHREYKNCVFKDDLLQLKPVGQASAKIINYNAKRSRFKFCLILYLLAKIYQLVEHNTKLTKREIFYQIKHLIKNQTQINDAIDEISCLLDVGIWKLNIVSQKGLVYGDLKVIFSSRETLDCNVKGTLIPFNVDEIVEIRSRASFILIVEKESMFHKLIEENLPNKMTKPFLMITGKGYPNLFTQLFVNKLWRIMSVPVFILVDPDPYGIHIMLNYRFGSLNNSHLSEDLAIPKARWLGVFPSEIVKLGVKTTPMSRRDCKMVQNLIASPYMKTNPQIKKELAILLEKNVKGAIEGLIKTNKFLSLSYLPTKFVNCDFI